MASASAWGIDLGNRGLKAIKLVRDGERFRIDEFEIIEHEQILSIAGDNKESLQKTALARFVERHNLRGSAVGVSVSGQSSFARFIKLPPVEPKKIPEIVRFEAVQQIPFPLDDVEWSYQLFQEKDSPDVEVGIFAMRKELVNRHITMFTDLGLNVQVVQMNPLAIYNGMFYDDHIAQTTMFMDCGAENTDLIIADGETVWLRTLPIGGNNFTETLAKNFKLNFAKAEELKRNAATSKYAKQIFQAMRPVFADLVAEIQRSIGFYASVHRDARIQRIIALGSTFQLPGLQKYLQQNLQLPVEKLDAFKALPPADAKLAAELPESVATLSGAYGLALQALGEAKISSSLLPEKIRRMKMWQEKTKWFAAAAALFVAGAIGTASSYYYHNYMYERNDSNRANYKQVLSNAEGLAHQWKGQVQDIGAEDRNKIKTLRTLQDHHSLWVDIATQILTSVPNKSIEELKKVPRAQRDLISLDSIQSRYWADLTEPIESTNFAEFVTRTESSMPAGGSGGANPGMGGMNPMMMMMMMRMRGMGMPGGGMGMPGGGMGAMPGFPPGMGNMMGNTSDEAQGTSGEKKGKRGFLVAIRGSTPRQAADGPRFVVETLVKNLQNLTEETALKQGKNFFVAKAELIRNQRRIPLGNESAAPAESLDPDMLGGADADSGTYTPPMDKDGNPLYHPNQDRNFPDEITEADTIFTVLAAIALDPTPPKKDGESTEHSESK